MVMLYYGITMGTLHLDTYLSNRPLKILWQTVGRISRYIKLYCIKHKSIIHYMIHDTYYIVGINTCSHDFESYLIIWLNNNILYDNQNVTQMTT